MILIACSPGGHLAQALLHVDALRADLGDDEVRILTAEPGHDVDLPVGVAIERMREVPPRGLGPAMLAVPTLAKAIRRAARTGSLQAVVSTGAGVAVPALGVARVLRQRAIFVESATRISEPSLSGKVVRRIPGVECRGQWPGLERFGFTLWRNVFDAHEAAALRPAMSPTQVLALTGTRSEFPFRRIHDVAAAVRAADPTIPIVVQDASGGEVAAPDIDVRPSVPEEEIAGCIDDGGAVLTHAGVGSTLRCLERHHRPFVVARRADRGEHVDDHQRDLARALSRRQLVHDLTDLEPTAAAAAVLGGPASGP